jgi:hypothetical protein
MAEGRLLAQSGHAPWVQITIIGFDGAPDHAPANLSENFPDSVQIPGGIAVSVLRAVQR